MATYPIVPTAEVALKYLALIEQDRGHLSELYDTGRWRLYYSDDELRSHARQLATLRDKWMAVAALGGNDFPSLRRWQDDEGPAAPQLPVDATQ